MTLKEIYPRWIKIREMEIAAVSLEKNRRAWNHFFADTYIIDVPLEDLTRFELKAYVTSVVRQHSLTKRYYSSEIKTLLNGLFDFAVELGALDFNRFRSIRLNPRIFRPAAIKRDLEEVFSPDEQRLVIRVAHLDAAASGSAIPLGIPLLFYTGLRIGELCALKWSDVDGDIFDTCVLHVRRMQVVNKRITSSGVCSAGYVIVDHAKTAAGFRDVVLPDPAIDLLEEIRDINMQHGISCDPDDYIFRRVGRYTELQGDDLCNSRVFDSRIRRYCRKICICVKSPHDIRRTYISALLESGMNPDLVRRLAGHENIEMTLAYCRNRMDVTEIQEDLNKIFLN